MRALLAAALAAAAFATPLLACGDPEWHGDNLLITPSVKAALRNAYLAAHRELRPADVRLPRRGRTYYGRYSGTRYAVATFRFGRTTIFRTDGHGRWHVRADTGGGICTDVVPFDLIAVWWLEPHGGDCYTVPA